MFRLVRVAGESMSPTYRDSDLLLARPVSPGRVRRGDVAVFRHGGLRLIKRAVGVPGDLVEVEAGRLFVNGQSVDGCPRLHGAYTQTWRVPAEGYFMAGDNPNGSDDSRVWDEPFVSAARIDMVIIRHLFGPGRVRGLRPGRPDPAAGRVA
ncbi:signal peptidase I [Cryobacterium melibiosiphilum]|uniref:Signal peptidase I n=1 Tax=Cryobacterium melibiosiphilum TaxID=995039 RepID=A0A3A5MEL6_9MICO|nr:signal peptidase I [Cryobacterium melibiosiphilum]RJT87892.1 signal peptidase I [Cryobacterium melibiosiphilum]